MKEFSRKFENMLKRYESGRNKNKKPEEKKKQKVINIMLKGSIGAYRRELSARQTTLNLTKDRY